jgi:hypothetical protein
MSNIQQLLAAMLLSLLAACGGNVEVDNGGNAYLKVYIDAQSYVLEPGMTKALSLDEGLHSIKVMDIKDEVLRDTVFEVSEGGLLNLGRSEYLIWKDVFSPQSTLPYRQELLDSRELVIDKKVFSIEYDTLPRNQLYVEQYWDYGLEESFPEKVYGWELDKGEKYMFKTKLVRKDQFVDTYMKAVK